MILGNKEIIKEVAKGNIDISCLPLDLVQQLSTLYDVQDILMNASKVCKDTTTERNGKNYAIESVTKEIANLEAIIPQLQGTSFDLTLDRLFLAPTGTASIYDPSNLDPEYQEKFFDRLTQYSYILQPRQRVLASTVEQIGSRSLGITTKIFSKSSWARHGLEVASCAGYGDPGYATHWTLEIYNKNPFSVELQAGMIIAQMSFERVEGCGKLYKSKYNNDGKNTDFGYSDVQRFQMMAPKPIKMNNHLMLGEELTNV